MADGLTRLEQAQKTILDAASPLGCEKVGLMEANGRVLGEDIIAPRDNPPWDNSAMDGFAVRWDDIKQEHAITKIPELRIVEDVPAGKMAEKSVGPGEAIRIMTGAPMPGGADTVVRVEFTEPLGTDQVRIMKPESGRGVHIRPKGEDVRLGDCIIAKGTLLRPGEIGMLAILAKSFVSVHHRPRVAILSTGDELADLDERFDESKIVNSNSYGIAAGVQEAGGVPVLLGIARDNPDSLKDKIYQGLTCDILVLSGGVSMGDYDFTKPVFAELGLENEFLEVGHSSRSARGIRQDPTNLGIWASRKSSVVYGDV